ncbi:hypothetical protein N7448_000356 [Penicillium atrosanguineum]|uniref:DUF7703 domain-containing protein n=1 Tax=Penicillium atrosanguineum TaxID=1132637 RepID=A0A9W9U7D9_9EURO|nr:uncharacterized protein N7443_003753 [Penicillium atrosanguineum]KAJ5134624.1 hypothetical protein N7526_005989 [Penicillium atrosanguineum]KAJ5148778.1 hypothetical protein N7448_000356 [Penicillium atrosanguineum]KAJ5304093.1 hypothetical protein N7443_003753 [Penicillium atrosanguineum]KAJ5323570.1 hypothetical protein N7476_002170 [Penicillium atrosanguineum]
MVKINCEAPVEGIVGAYTDNSFAFQASITSLIGCAMYSALELIVLVFLVFSRYHGLYFWSLLITSSCGIIPDALGLVLKYFELAPIWIPVTLSTAGWTIMVTGQSLVLYSRLHLVVYNTKVLRFVLGMIIFDAITMQIPQIIASYGAVFACQKHFMRFFNIWEKVQLTVFFVQEIIISTIFIVAAMRLMRLNPTWTKRRSNLMFQLLTMNFAIIAMDVSLLTLEFLSLFILQTVLKVFFYTVKLKLEIAVLSRLSAFARSHYQDESSGLSGLT